MAERSVAVVGGGTMGIGIAYRFAVAGASVYLVDLDMEHAEESVTAARAAMERAVERGKLDRDTAAKAGARITATPDIESVPKGLSLIVEAVLEQPELKSGILERAEGRSPEILASNTSSISIDSLAAGLDAPEAFAGMHFFNPVWAMDLVEVPEKGGVAGARGKIQVPQDLLQNATRVDIELFNGDGHGAKRETEWRWA